MTENQSMAALVFFHWLESVEDLMVVLTRSRMDLLMAPMLFLAGLISLHLTLLGKESLWSFIVIKASSSVVFINTHLLQVGGLVPLHNHTV